ncbi:MAG: 30S ribosomal protein S12 methylthiotransferase RimO [Spirochaetes bacterium]|nr:30S ribosomal protein S12 methylthiotransferase RimO [Spirochaetota bacterium]
MFQSQDISFHIISLGCAKNQVDSERINGALLSAGYLPAESSEHADIIIINTCGFITDAKEESIAMIFDAVEQQKSSGESNMKPFFREGRVLSRDFGRRVVVVGCLSQRYPEALEIEIPEIDFLVGVPDGRFVELMSGKLHVAVAPPAVRRAPLLPGLSYSYIKIAEGCSHRCSYCAIPLIRGTHESFPPEMVLDDARAEADRGARELVIVAQDITAYRREDTGLPGLVGSLCRLPGVEWVRLMYCHPDHVDESVISIFEREEKVVPYIDIPFQHVSRRILRSMGRKGDAAACRAVIERLRERVPDIRIRSTFMTGYPGETWEEFEELLAFLEWAQLDRVGAFVFSPEEGTRAAGLGGQVPERVKKDRHDSLMSLQREISERKLAGMIGDVVRVLVEEQIDETTWAGRTEYDAPEVDGIFYLTARNVRIHSIVNARVTGSTEYDCIGEHLP